MTELEKEALEKLLQMTFWAYLIDTKHRDTIPKSDIAILEKALRQNESLFPLAEAQNLLDFLYNTIALPFDNCVLQTVSKPENASDTRKRIINLFSHILDKNTQDKLLQEIILCFYKPVNAKTDPPPSEHYPSWQCSDWLPEHTRQSFTIFMQQNDVNGAIQQLICILDVLGRLRETLASMQNQKHTLAKDSHFWQHSSYVLRNEILGKEIDDATAAYVLHIRKILSKLNQPGYLQQNLEDVTKIHDAMETQLSCFIERRQALDDIHAPIEALITAKPFSLENTLEYCSAARKRAAKALSLWQEQYSAINPTLWSQEPEPVQIELNTALKNLQDKLEGLYKRMGQYSTSVGEQRQTFKTFFSRIPGDAAIQTTGLDPEHFFTLRDFSNLNSEGSHRQSAATNYLLCLSDIEWQLEACQASTRTLAEASMLITTWAKKRETIHALRRELSQKLDEPVFEKPKETSLTDKVLARLNGQSQKQEIPVEQLSLLRRFERYIDAFGEHKSLKGHITRTQASIEHIKNAWAQTKLKSLPEHASGFFQTQEGTILAALHASVADIAEQENALMEVQNQIIELTRHTDELTKRYTLHANSALKEVSIWQERIHALYAAGADSSTKAILLTHRQDDTEQASETQTFIDEQMAAINAVRVPDILPKERLTRLIQDCQEKQDALTSRFAKLKAHLHTGLQLDADSIRQKAPIIPHDVRTLPLDNHFALPLKGVFERFTGCQNALDTALKRFFNGDKPTPEEIAQQIRLIESHIHSAESASKELSSTWKQYQIMQKRLAFAPYQQLLLLQKTIDDEIERLKSKSNTSDPRIQKLRAIRNTFGEEFTRDYFTIPDNDDALNLKKQREALEQFTQKLANAIIASFQARALKDISATVQHKLLQILRAILAFLPRRSVAEDSPLGKTAPLATLSELTLFNAGKQAIVRIREERFEATNLVGVG